MIQYLTPNDIANTVRMSRNLHCGAFLIVEGGSDARTYGRFVDGTRCTIVPAHGKNVVIASVQVLEQEGMRGVLAIVDADHARIDNTPRASSNVLLTDGHDLEMMIFASPALDHILDEFASPSKLAAMSCSAREVVLRCALPLGILRWLASPCKWSLDLSINKAHKDRFIDRTNMKIDIDLMLREVVSVSRPLSMEEDALRRELDKLVAAAVDLYSICNGHDVVDILTMGLRAAFGCRRASHLSMDAVDVMLRLAFEPAHFYRTELYRSIQSWQDSNAPFVVIKEP